MITLHATSVALDDRAVLISGEPGSGKSDLALRIIEAGGQLISDDYTNLMKKGDHLIASPPPKIAGRMEVRGVGIIEIAYQSGVQVALVIQLTDRTEIERLPEEASTELEGVRIPEIRLDAFEVSATAKIRVVLARLLTA